MTRPVKRRKVCCMPKIELIQPVAIDGVNNDVETVLMTIEEFETIRLIDFEKLTQEECAKKMEVARTTVQSIYSDARFKLAKTLVNGNTLQIQGGNYQLYSEKEREQDGCCRQSKKHRRRRGNKNENSCCK